MRWTTGPPPRCDEGEDLVELPPPFEDVDETVSGDKWGRWCLLIVMMIAVVMVIGTRRSFLCLRRRCRILNEKDFVQHVLWYS